MSSVWCKSSAALTAALGGYVGHDITAEVLRFDASTDQWVRAGDMQEARVDHAVSVVNMLDIMPYCQG